MRAVPTSARSSSPARSRSSARRRGTSTPSRPSCAAASRVGREPEPRRGRGPPLLPELRGAPGAPEAALLLVNHERVEDAFEEAAAAGVRAFVVPGVGAEAGVAAKPTTERLAPRARARRRAARPELHGRRSSPADRRPGSAAAPTTTAPGHVAVALPVGLDRGRVPLARRPRRLPLRRLVGRRGGHRRGRLPRVLRRGRGDARRRALPRDRAPTGGVRRRARARAPRPDKPVACLKVGRSEAAARAALSHTGALVGSGRAFSAVLRRYGAIEVEDFHELVETLEILGRRRWPRGRRHRRRSRSRAASARCSPTRPRRRASRSSRSRRPRRARSQAEFPNFLAPGNPLDAWAVADESEVVSRARSSSWPSPARSTSCSAQADLSQFRDETNDEWCELTLRTLARLADEHDLFGADDDGAQRRPAAPLPGARARARPAAPPRAARLDARARARRSAGGPCATAAPDERRAGLARPPRAPGALPEHESALVLERYGVPFAPRRRAATRTRPRRPRASSAHRSSSSSTAPAHKSRDGGVVLGVDTPDEAADGGAPAGRPGARRQAGRAAAPRSLCGMTRDPDFGPVLAVGRGRRRRRAARPASRSPSRRSTSTPPASSSPRPGSTTRGDVVARTLVALGGSRSPTREIESIDVNPLIVGPTGRRRRRRADRRRRPTVD